MTCPHCIEKNREIVGLRAEIEEWKRQGELLGYDPALVALKRALGLPPAEAKAVQMLSAAGGQVVGTHRLAFAIHAGQSEEPSPDCLKVRICRARQAMKRAGIEGAIHTVWGAGYMMDAIAAEQIRALIAA